MILQELHSAYSNQLAASLHSETPSGELGKLLAPPGTVSLQLHLTHSTDLL